MFLEKKLQVIIPIIGALVFTVFQGCSRMTSGDKAIAGEGQKPNILFIMADDHAAQAVGIYGSRLAPLDITPTLDKLAREGMIFDNAFVTNSICTPSRASIITGQYSQTNSVLDLEGVLPEAKQYLPQEMNRLGYQTAVVGKWHLTNEPLAFDYYAVLPGQGKYFDPSFRVQGDKSWPYNIINKKGHSTDVITELTIEWLENKRDRSKPFFLSLHYKAPHDMFKFAPRYKDYLEYTFLPEPVSLYYNANNGSIATRGINDSLIHIIGASVSKRNTHWGLGRRLGIDQNVEDPKYSHLVYQEYLKRYLRCVKGIDDNVKRLLNYLEAQGLMNNTIIVYTSDQGLMLGEHDYMDKRWMYEESMRVPFIVRYPKTIAAGSRTDAIINNTDFAPTLIEIAGGKAPEYMQGHSFKTILETGKEPENWQQFTYYRYWMHMAHNLGIPAHFGIRTKDYKLIFFYGRYWVDTDDPDATWNKKSWGNDFTRHTPVAWEFYNLKNDPHEMNNLYGDPRYKQIIDDLKKQLAEKRTKLNKDDTTYPHIQKIIDRHWND